MNYITYLMSITFLNKCSLVLNSSTLLPKEQNKMPGLSEGIFLTHAVIPSQGNLA